jgi:hypothetical protein
MASNFFLTNLLTLLVAALPWVKILGLGWALERTKHPAIGCYLVYVIIHWITYSTLIQRAIPWLESRQDLGWLGHSSTEQITNSFNVLHLGLGTIETALFLWMLWSLIQDNRSNRSTD